MPITVQGRTVTKVAVVGSGNIGPDIALHFAQNLAPLGVKTVVVDVVQKAVDAGKARTEKKLAKGVEKGKVKPEAARLAAESILWTVDYEQLRGADLVVEAATEDEGLKKKIFAQVERLVPPTALLTSNSSHMEPEVIFAGIADKKRTACVHYFFPAERNIVVEVIPGAETAPDVTAFLLRFYEALGKMPIRVKSRYGYSVDPIFEGNFLAAALLVEEGAGTVKEVDEAARKALGLGVGPFTAMNLTGGNPITNHGLEIEGQKIMPWYRSPESLKQKVKDGTAWPTAGKDEKVDVPADKAQRIADDMLGAYFGMAAEIVDSGIASIGDLDVAVENALVMKPPFRTMNAVGVGRALELVQSYAGRHPGFKVAEVLVRQAATGKPFDVPFVFREDVGDVAVVTIRRPAVLNALSATVLRQLQEQFEAIGKDAKIVGAVLTGFGTRAFVSGADVNELASLPDGPAMKAHSLAAHQTGITLENLGKPVVCAMNGLAFGGGNELAMSCTMRIAAKGLKVFVGQPEVKLGIIPGLGGTQRLPRLIGLAAAWPILRNAEPISSARALELGLIAEEVAGDVRERGIALVREIVAGKVKPTPIERGPLEIPAKLPDVELGALSKKIDAILQEAILGGARRKLEDGLRYEAEMLASCHATKDMRIGLDNFVKNGPKVAAPFVHE